MINVTTLILKLSISDFLDGDVPSSTSYGVYISQLIRFARASIYVTDFNTRSKLLTQELLKQGYRCHKVRHFFFSDHEFYGDFTDLVYKLKKIIGFNNFSAQFIKIISIIKRLAITLIYCNRLHAWWSTQSRLVKVSNGAKIRNRYNQVPHLTQDTNGKVTNSQKTPQTRAKRSALSQQVTTKHI